MEDVLDVYHRPYDPDYPVVCMDETSKQRIQETRSPLSMKPGKSARYDYEYRRNGVSNLFIAVEPLKGTRRLKGTQRRTKKDWAVFIRDLVDTHYHGVKKIILVLDNLNTHKKASLYEAFEPKEAKRIADKLEMHYTPKHGSWLNIAEIELSVLYRQCLNRRIPDHDTLIRETGTWELDRNNKMTKVNWQFTTEKARIKLHSLYPKELNG